jgi:DNA-binding transcriptional LysR family regulator
MGFGLSKGDTLNLVVAPTGHPVLRMHGLTLEKLARFPVIMQNPSRLQGARIERMFRDAGIEVHVAVQALDTDVMKAYVAAGLGWALPSSRPSLSHRGWTPACARGT